jgi:hypothetical protein
LNVPEFVIAAPPNSVSSNPVPDTSVSPWNLSGSKLIFLPAPLIVAEPTTVSGASSTVWLEETLQVKSPSTVTPAPDNDAFVSVRSCRLMSGMSVRLGNCCDPVGPIVTVSPACGTSPP